MSTTEGETKTTSVDNSLKEEEGEKKTSDRKSLGNRKEKVIVRVVFLKIADIETVKERFHAEAFVQAKWREPSLDGLIDSPQKIEELDWDGYWNPKLTLVNARDEFQESVGRSVLFNAQGEAFVCERRKIKGKFHETLELDRFPFDTQDISLTIASNRPEKEVVLVADDVDLSRIHLHSFVDQQEWILYKHVVAVQGTIQRTEEASSERHASLTFSCRASRRVGFFMWNVFFVMFFICSMTFTTFALSMTLLPNRIQLTLILLLTTMTYKFSVNQYLPKISYLTYLDSYILTAMVAICLICAWHAVAGSFVVHAVGEKEAFWIDKYVFSAFVVAYFGGHALLVIVIYVVVSNERSKDEKDEQDYLRQVFLSSEKSQQVPVELFK